jgi:hypothetical protein
MEIKDCTVHIYIYSKQLLSVVWNFRGFPPNPGRERALFWRIFPPCSRDLSVILFPDVLSLWMFCPHGRFVPQMLCLRMFCPHRCFVCRTFCPSGCFVPPDVLSLWTFCPSVLCLWTLCLGTFCLGTLYPFVINPNPDGYNKVWSRATGNHIWPHPTNRKLGGLPVRAPLPCHIPIGHLGVIYNSQPVEKHEITITNTWTLLILVEKSL